jgi:hypothetical protein
MAVRRPVASIVVPIIVGCIGFFSLMQRPRFQTYHTVDVLQLVASGMCFGVALAAIFMLLRKPGAR